MRKMKRNRVFRRFAAVFLALFCMAATSTVAFAGGGDGGLAAVAPPDHAVTALNGGVAAL